MGFTTERQENKTHITVQSSPTGRVKVHSISPPTLKESGTWDRINRSVRQSVISDDSCASWNTGRELSEMLALSGHLNTRLTRFQRCFRWITVRNVSSYLPNDLIPFSFIALACTL